MRFVSLKLCRPNFNVKVVYSRRDCGLCYLFGALKYIHALFGGTRLELLFVNVL